MLDTSKLKQSNDEDKIERYNWKLIDSPGELRYVPKTNIEIDHTYQRLHSTGQVRRLSREWSWLACGVIIVGERLDNTLVAIDGQHRLLAALNRSDIQNLPCIIFKINSIAKEAECFVISNTHRKGVKTIEKHIANIIAKDETALFIDNILKRNNIELSDRNTSPSLLCIGQCYNIVETDKDNFETILQLSSALCANSHIPESILGGIYILSKQLNVPITDIKFKKHLFRFTVQEYVRGINEARVYFGKGGRNIWAKGMLDIINKGLRTKYYFK